MSDYQVIIHKDLLPDGVSVEDVFMAVEVRPVQSVEIKPYLDRLVEACRVLSGHIEWDIERGVIQLHDIVQGHVTAYRQESAPEMYAALQAVKYWSFAEAELEELRGKAMEIDAALTEAQKQLEVLSAERDAGNDTEGGCRRALQDIYDLTNSNFPADLQTRLDAIRHTAVTGLERWQINPLTRKMQAALEERDWWKRQAESIREELDSRGVPCADLEGRELSLAERFRLFAQWGKIVRQDATEDEHERALAERRYHIYAQITAEGNHYWAALMRASELLSHFTCDLRVKDPNYPYWIGAQVAEIVTRALEKRPSVAELLFEHDRS